MVTKLNHIIYFEFFKNNKCNQRHDDVMIVQKLKLTSNKIKGGFTLGCYISLSEEPRFNRTSRTLKSTTRCTSTLSCVPLRNVDLHTLKQLLCPQRQEGCQYSRSAENKTVNMYSEVNEIWKRTNEQVIMRST